MTWYTILWCKIIKMD